MPCYWSASPSHPTFSYVHASLVATHTISMVIKPRSCYYHRLKWAHMHGTNRQKRLLCCVPSGLDHEGSGFYTDSLEETVDTKWQWGKPISCKAVFVQDELRERKEVSDTSISLSLPSPQQTLVKQSSCISLFEDIQRRSHLLRLTSFWIYLPSHLSYLTSLFKKLFMAYFRYFTFFLPPASLTAFSSKVWARKLLPQPLFFRQPGFTQLQWAS